MYVTHLLVASSTSWPSTSRPNARRPYQVSAREAMHRNVDNVFEVAQVCAREDCDGCEKCTAPSSPVGDLNRAQTGRRVLAKIKYPPQWLLEFRYRVQYLEEQAVFQDCTPKCLTCSTPRTRLAFCSKFDRKCASCKDVRSNRYAWWNHKVYSTPAKSHDIVKNARKTIQTFADHCRTVNVDHAWIDEDLHERLFACSIQEGFESAIRIGIDNLRKWCPVCEKTATLKAFAYKTCCAYSAAKHYFFKNEVSVFKTSLSQVDYLRAVHASNLYCLECEWNHGCFPSTPKAIKVCKEMLAASVHLPFEVAIALSYPGEPFQSVTKPATKTDYEDDDEDDDEDDEDDDEEPYAWIDMTLLAYCHLSRHPMARAARALSVLATCGAFVEQRIIQGARPVKVDALTTADTFGFWPVYVKRLALSFEEKVTPLEEALGTYEDDLVLLANILLSPAPVDSTKVEDVHFWCMSEFGLPDVRFPTLFVDAVPFELDLRKDNTCPLPIRCLLTEAIYERLEYFSPSQLYTILHDSRRVSECGNWMMSTFFCHDTHVLLQRMTNWVRLASRTSYRSNRVAICELIDYIWHPLCHEKTHDIDEDLFCLLYELHQNDMIEDEKLISMLLTYEHPRVQYWEDLVPMTEAVGLRFYAEAAVHKEYGGGSNNLIVFLNMRAEVMIRFLDWYGGTGVLTQRFSGMRRLILDRILSILLLDDNPMFSSYSKQYLDKIDTLLCDMTFDDEKRLVFRQLGEIDHMYFPRAIIRTKETVCGLAMQLRSSCAQTSHLPFPYVDVGSSHCGVRLASCLYVMRSTNIMERLFEQMALLACIALLLDRMGEHDHVMRSMEALLFFLKLGILSGRVCTNETSAFMLLLHQYIKALPDLPMLQGDLFNQQFELLGTALHLCERPLVFECMFDTSLFLACSEQKKLSKFESQNLLHLYIDLIPEAGKDLELAIAFPFCCDLLQEGGVEPDFYDLRCDDRQLEAPLCFGRAFCVLYNCERKTIDVTVDCGQLRKAISMLRRAIKEKFASTACRRLIRFAQEWWLPCPFYELQTKMRRLLLGIRKRQIRRVYDDLRAQKSVEVERVKIKVESDEAMRRAQDAARLASDAAALEAKRAEEKAREVLRAAQTDKERVRREAELRRKKQNEEKEAHRRAAFKDQVDRRKEAKRLEKERKIALEKERKRLLTEAKLEEERAEQERERQRLEVGRTLELEAARRLESKLERETEEQRNAALAVAEEADREERRRQVDTDGRLALIVAAMSGVDESPRERSEETKTEPPHKAASVVDAVSRPAEPSIPPLRSDTSSEASGLCVVCLNAPHDHLLMPCFHLCVCKDCVAKCKSVCPLCRQTVKSSSRVFLPS